MLRITFRLFAAVVLAVWIAAPTVAAAEEPASLAEVISASSTKALQKAQRKTGRKDARARNDAELQKLEAAGYNPSAGNNVDYPQNIQNAEKKAASPGGASQ